MKSLLITTSAIALLGVASVADARFSSSAERRGYEHCVDEAKDQSNGLVVAGHFFVENEVETNKYYVNGTRWEEGSRNHVGIACETNRSGHKLLSADIRDGRYVQARPNVRIELATN